MSSTEKKLIAFVKSIVKDAESEIFPETLLFEKKLLDSMNILNLIGFIEQHLDRRLKDSEIVMSNFKSINTIINIFFNEREN